MAVQKSLALILSVGLFYPTIGQAASCCGGGGGAALLIPKLSGSMVDISFDNERYDGFWDKHGNKIADPAGSDLQQYRLNLGMAYRLADNWQASISLPYVWNRNQYAGFSRNTNGIGDSSISLWYEQFDDITCVWKVNDWKDLQPSIYWGATLTLPTGTSPYGEIKDNFDITGLGMYRIDANVIVDKTVYPWNATFAYSYGRYLERPVNRENGVYVKPYDKQRGDRSNISLSVGYTLFDDHMNSTTLSIGMAELEEDETTYDGVTDPTSGLAKRSVTTSAVWATDDKRWMVKFAWNSALDENGAGKNFPITDTYTLGVSRVLP